METKTSKSLEEVWTMKDNLHKELSTIPKTDHLKYIQNKVRHISDRMRKKQKV